jgi:hypothetical protein
MRRIVTVSTLALLTISGLTESFAASLNEHAPNPNEIRVVPVDPTPEPFEIKTTIEFPKEGKILTSQKASCQVRLEGYPLGTDSEFPRAKEIWNDPKGQGLHICIDSQPYFEMNEALIDALDDVQEYYDQTVNFDIPFDLQPGMHVMRVFPVRSFNEGLKGSGCFAARIFYYRDKKDNLSFDPSKPYLTFNEPQGEYDFGPDPLLLDFYITNCELSKDGYKVRLTIDSDNQRVLTQWAPYYIYGLTKGKHIIRLELIDAQNKLVPGVFNDVSKTLILQ